MSVIRTNKTDTRGARFIAPYTRWFSRILGVQSSEESEAKVESSTSTDKDLTSLSGSRLSTSHALTSEHQMSNPEYKHQPNLTPSRSKTASKIASSSTSSPGVDIASFLSQSSGQSVSAEEVEGMLAMLRENTPPESREIFRFSSTPTRDLQSSPSTPLTTRKKLPRNPNGVYRWEGAGSAKHIRPRNRFSSPAFGASPSKKDRSAMEEIMDPEDTPLPDSKKRRVGDGSSSSSVSAQRPSISEPTARKVPFPSTASPTPGTNGVSNRLSPLPSPSRLRTPVKPTAPVVPSPLRQTWSETSSTSSQNEPRKTPPQTKTASFMAELIKEAIPPKKPDLANPYQLASPVGKVGPPRRSTKRPRATGRPVAPTKTENDEEKGTKEEAKEKENSKDYSPQTIIEATVPKGSQRSRPPAHFEKPTDFSITKEESSHQSPRPQHERPAVIETSKIPYVVEEGEDDDAEEARRYAKRTKSSINGSGPTPTATKSIEKEPEIIIDVLEDIDMDAAEQKDKTREQPKLSIQINENGSSTSRTSTSPTTAISPTSSRNKLSSAPKEPSKLRFSFQPEGTSVPSSPAFKPAPLPTPPGLSKTDFKFEPPSANFNFTFNSTNSSPGESPKPQEQAKKVKVKNTSDEEIKAKARSMTASSLPTFVMTSSATSVLPSAAVASMRRRVKGLSVSSLPSFDLSSGPVKSATPFSFGFDPTNPKSKPSTFTFGPSSSSPQTVGNSNSPKSSSIFGVNNTSAPPVPEATVSVIKPFDFAAAGMTVPSNKPGTWICSLCALSNPSSASKCQTCDTPAISTPPAVAVPPPAPSPAPPVAPAIKAFDFAAAGMKAPSVASGTWICSLCALTNPISANQCETCETTRTVFS